MSHNESIIDDTALEWFHLRRDYRLHQGFGGQSGGRVRELGYAVVHVPQLAPQGMAGFVLANGSMSSNQSGDCPARSAMTKPKAKPQSLPRQDVHD